LTSIAQPDGTVAADRLKRGAFILIALFCSVHFLIMVLRAHLNHASGDPGIQDPVQAIPKRFLFALFGAVMCYVIYRGLRPLRRAPFMRQATVGATLAFVIACIQACGNAVLFNRGGDHDWLPNFLYSAMYWFWFFLSWTTAYLALSYSLTVQEQERHAAELALQAQEAQVRALRYQINPHFLFNTLNAIAALVRDAPDKAEEMVMQLSEFFRRSLAVNPMEDVTLSEEADLQRLYLEIERTRFPDRLRFEVALDGGSAEARVPALLLQPLVENAVKHGVARSEAAACIRIRARVDGPAVEIVVENDAQASGRRPRGESVGLRNVRDRLRSRFGDEAALATEELAAGGFRNTLRIPLNR
jgi:two-component sensor histidine kinase